MSSKVTMKTIAEAVGTSVGTVDRALNNRGRINPDMKAQILLAAEELGYKPNLSARSLRKDALFKLLIVTRKEPRFFYHALQLGFDDALNEYLEFGVHSEFIYSDSMSKEDTCSLLKRMDISSYSALLIDAWYPELSQFALRFKRNGKLVVAVHLDLPEKTRDVFIGTDIQQGGILAANYIGELLRNHGSLSILDAHRASALWLDSLTRELSDQYPNITIQKAAWEDISQLPDTAVVLACGPIEPQQQPLLAVVKGAVVCNEFNEVIYQMLRQKQVAAVICDTPYMQGYQSVKCIVEGLIRNVEVIEDAVQIPPQLLLRASLQSVPVPPTADDGLKRGD